MHLPRPRSLSSLLLLGLLLLTIPMAVAVSQAGIQLSRLAAETDLLVRRGVELTDHSQSLFRLMSALERSANLYLLLADPRLIEASREIQRQISETTDQLGAMPLDPAGDAKIQTLRRSAVAVLAALEFGGPEVPDRSALLTARLDELNNAANDVSSHAISVLENELTSLRSRAAATRRTLMIWLAALAPAAAALGLLFTLGVLRPLRRADRAITQLGQGGFSHPIAIRGPSDIEALGRQLEWLRVHLLELAQDRNRFLRNLSHELKTPLASIREGTDLLLDGSVGNINPQQREVTIIMRSNAVRLQQLIENLLSYGAWQSQAAALEISTFALEDELTASLKAQKLALVARRIHTKLDVEHTQIDADRARIRLVLDNLLSNALKFTPEEGLITVSARREGEEVVINFADNGPGVPLAEREHIFDPFYTGSTPQAGHLKGTGIGLSIVAEYVGAHGGKVELVQGEFPGAHFRIHLPTKAREGEPSASLAYA